MRTAMHIVKRLLLMIVGYLVGVTVALISVVILYFVLSSLPGAPSYFGAMGMSPLLILIFPPAWLVVIYIAVILTGVPSLVGALFAELFSLRQVWLHGPLGAAIGAGAFIYASPVLVGAIGGTDWADLAIVVAAGFCGGVAYWLIAGRKAGFTRPVPVANSYVGAAPHEGSAQLSPGSSQ
jgi:hypothetical protein